MDDFGIGRGARGAARGSAEVRFGRSSSAGKTPVTAGAGRKRVSVPEAAAAFCALICAAVLCVYCIAGTAGGEVLPVNAAGAETAADVSYTPPEKAEEWSFWDYFSELCAGIFGYGEA